MGIGESNNPITQFPNYPITRFLLPPAFFCALAVVTTWPLAAHLTSQLGAPYGPGDPFLNLWILGWNLKTITLHPGWLFTGRVFDANIFYPSVGTLAYSDHQLVQSLAVWPLYAVTHNLTLCYNIVLLASLVLSAWAMFGFVRAVTGSRWAGYCAGLAWGFCPFHFSHLIHLQLQALYWMPLTFWLLHRLVAGRRLRDAIGFGIVIALQALGSVYYGVIGVVGLAAAAMVVVTRTGGWPPRLLWRFALAAVVAIVVAAPGLWPYWVVQRREGFARTLYEAEHHSATVDAYVRVPPTNLVEGRTGLMAPPQDPEADPTTAESEDALFPGLVVVALAALGLVRARRAGMSLLAVSMAVVGGVGFLLSFGPRGWRAAYALLHDNVFGFQAIRAPARFSILVSFALAVLAGIGLASLARRRPGSVRVPSWAPVLILVLLSVEFSNGAMAFAPAPSLSTDVGRWLRDEPEPGPVLYLPVGNARDDSTAMVASLEHGRPIVNGYSGQRPALYQAVVDQLAGFPDRLSLLTLRDLDVRFVVVPSLPPTTLQLTPLVERARFADGVVYELQWTPEIGARFDEQDSANSTSMLPPGAVPFETGETSRYRIRIVGGPIQLPAADATISGARAADGSFRFDVHATTARWVRSLFEADDQLSAEADAQLLPRVYRESLNEGRRRTRRSVVFDAGAKRATVTNGDTAPVTLPLSPGARDPLTALFYVRTLALAGDFHAPLVVNDAGRNTTVDVKVVGSESITIDGHTYETWKVEPTFVTRLAWRQPRRATIWVSRDRRQVPVLIRVSDTFGTLEAELVDYRSW